MPKDSTSSAEGPRPFGGRRRIASGAGGGLRLSLLPLLDVLTSTIGVFLIIMTFQVYASAPSGGTPAADLLIVVDPDDSFLLVTPGAATPQPLLLSQLRAELLVVGRPLKRPVRILAAFGPRALPGKQRLQHALDTLARRDTRKAAAGEDGGIAAVAESIGFTLAWVPLDSSGNERTSLLRRWTSADPE